MKSIVFLSLVTTLISFNALSAGDPKEESVVNAAELVQEWVQDNLEYPPRAIEGKEEGTVEVTFTLVNGKVEAWVSKSVSRNLDAEALTTVEEIPTEILLLYAKAEGEHYSLPIKFTLI